MTYSLAVFLGMVYFLWMWRRYVLRHRWTRKDVDRLAAARELRDTAAVLEMQSRRRMRR